MCRGRGQPFIAAPAGAVRGRLGPTAHRERHPRRPLPSRLARHRRARRRRRVRSARRAGQHVVVVRPALGDRARARSARPDARRHAGGHRPVDARRHLLRREPHRRRRRGLEPQPSRRDPRRSRRRRARGARQRPPRRCSAAESAHRHARGGADRPRLEQQVLARRRDEPAQRAGRARILGDGTGSSGSATSSGRGSRSRSCSRSSSATRCSAGASRQWARTRERPGWRACACGRTSCSRTPRQARSTPSRPCCWRA